MGSTKIGKYAILPMDPMKFVETKLRIADVKRSHFLKKMIFPTVPGSPRQMINKGCRMPETKRKVFRFQKAISGSVSQDP